MIEQFHFLRPAWLLLLLPLAALTWRLLRSRYDSGSWRGVIDANLLPFVLSGASEGRSNWMRWVFVTAALLSIIALAGPTWEKLPQPVYQQQSALIIALDLSRSMNATDIKPSRLTRARHKIADILNLRLEGQTALLVYAADAFTVTPLTSDVDTILALLPALETGMMPAQGSRADRALELAFDLFESGGVSRGDVLLISDGLNEDELSRAETILDSHRGHRLSVLAIGTAEGGPIPLKDGGFLQDRNGAIVIADMRENSLREVAQLGGGVYATISADDIDINTLAYLMESSIDETAARRAEYSADLWRELGPWLLLFALPLAALAFRRGLIFMLPLLLVTPPDAQAFDWQSLWRNQDQRASRLFDQGEHAAAAEMFENPDWRASSSYRAGDYENALKTWQGINSEDALYNRGNALARLGRFEEALDNYARLLRDNPGHADALHNKEVIEKFLEQQKQQQQQQQQQGTRQEKQPSNDGQAGDQAQGAQQQDSQQSSQAGQDDGSQAPMPTAEQGEADAQTASEPAADKGDDGQQSADAQPQSVEAGDAGDANAAERDGSQTGSLDEKMTAQAAEQWLRKVPDDPGGLLRRKFYYQYRKRGGVETESQPW